MKNNMLINVLIAMVLGIIFGQLTGADAAFFGITWVRIYHLIGQLFLNALSLVVVPLVASSIINGSARMGGDASFKQLGLKTCGMFFLNVALAATVGMLMAIVMQPGVFNESSISHSVAEISVNTSVVEGLAAGNQGDVFSKIESIFYKLIPTNIIAAASQGQMMGLIVFCLLFGYFSSRIDKQYQPSLQGFWQGLFQVMMLMTHLIMKFLPLGVFGLVAKVAATTGADAIKPVFMYVLALLLAFSVHLFITLPLLLWMLGRINPLLHMKAMLPAMVTAFSTSSSAATLPIAMECVEEKAGVSKRISSFALPLGASLNMSGTAIFIALAVVFIAQIYGLPLSLNTYITILLMSIFTSFGIAGIPSASIVAAIIVLQSIGLPAEGIALILAIDRLMDMCRTTVNVYGNTCCAAMIAASVEENTALANATVN